MNQARNARRLAVVVAFVYAVVLALFGVKVPDTATQMLAYFPSAIAFAVVIFDKWAWRWPTIHRFVQRPDIQGTWHVELTPGSGSLIPEDKRGSVHAYMVIEQTYWSIHLTQISRESRSVSWAVAMTPDQGRRQQRLVFSYENKPKQEHQPRSPQHEGACTLCVSAGRPTEVEGIYFTSRLTRGDMELTKINSQVDAASYKVLSQRYPVS